MRMVIALVLIAACKHQVTVDCDKYIAHIDELARVAIATLPDEQREPAEQRRVEGRVAVVDACKAVPMEYESTYDCEMASTSLREFKACK
jgi:hypothetical protein